MNCEFCHSAVHVWFDCPKKPNGWKPARLANKSASGRETDADSPLGRLPPKSASDDKSGRSQTKSTAARKDVRALEVSVPRSRKATATLSGSIPDAAKANDVAPQAGTQALPVDTNSEKGRVFAAPLGLASPANASDAKAADTKDAAKFDRVAYQREYMRKRRAAKK